jgi:hypothetical protein
MISKSTIPPATPDYSVIHRRPFSPSSKTEHGAGNQIAGPIGGGNGTTGTGNSMLAADHPPASRTRTCAALGRPRQEPNWPSVACPREPWRRSTGCDGAGQASDCGRPGGKRRGADAQDAATARHGRASAAVVGDGGLARRRWSREGSTTAWSRGGRVRSRVMASDGAPGLQTLRGGRSTEVRQKEEEGTSAGAAGGIRGLQPGGSGAERGEGARSRNASRGERCR